MKQIILSCLLLVFAMVLHAQTVSIFDQVTRQPVPWASITNQGQTKGVVTDTRGKTDLSVFSKDEIVEIRCVGYKTKLIRIADIEKAGYKVFLTEELISLNAVVVSASKWKQPKREVPMKISTLNSKDVLFGNPQTAADMMTQTGGVFVQKSQLGGGSPMIRGFATNRLLISVDGVRMNNAIFRSGNLQNIISIDPFAVDKVEVIYGPGSVIYGSDAIAGAMNFFTLTPMLSSSDEALVKANVVGRYSSASFEKTGHIDLNVGFRRWASVTSFSYNDFDDLIMGSIGTDEYLRNMYVIPGNGTDSVAINTNPRKQIGSEYHQYNIMQKLRFTPSEKWDFNYSFYYSATGDYGRYDRLIRPKGSTLRSAEWYYGPQTWMMNHVNLNHIASSGIYDNLSIHLSHQLFGESRFDRDLNKTIRHERYEKVNAYAINVDLEKKAGEKHRLHYGAEAVYNQIGSSGIERNVVSNEAETGPSRYPDNSDWSSLALYAGYHFKASDKLNIQAGMRYNHYLLNAVFDTTFYPFPFTEAHLNDGALTGSLGLVYSPIPTLQIILNGSSGFRSPNMDDIGKVFDSSPGFVIVPNPELEAEYAWNADLAIAKTFGDFMRIDITGYYTYLDNAIVRRNSSLNGLDSLMYDGEMSRVQSLQNAAFARVYGIQGALEIKLPVGIGFSASLNYQKGTEELDDGSTAPLRHAAPMFGSGHLTYTRNRMKFDFYTLFNAEVSYEELAPEEQGKDYIYAIDQDGNPYSPGWYTLNCRALYQITENFSATAGVENIANIRYRPYSSGICAPGRNFIVSVKASF
ncbi:MAG TPA: TonB-dependent receptor [Bacteroidales bacterium]|mgnify:CR=1 FL=1|nr:TonB-dependent receptor [Bacteroidales bacterium]